MDVQKNIQLGRDANATFGCDFAEPKLKDSRVSGMHFQPHFARTTFAPTAFSQLPAEIENAPATQTVATDMIFVERARRAKIRVFQRVRENTQRREEVLKRMLLG